MNNPVTPNEVLANARSIQAEAAKEGFDWAKIGDVLDKVREEVEEIAEALDGEDMDHARIELGDLLFATVNLSRFLDADPSEELRKASDRFSKRYMLLKTELEARNLIMSQCTLAQLNLVWEEVKKKMGPPPKKDLT